MEDIILERICRDISSNNPSVEEVKKELEKISNRGRSEWKEHSPLVSAVKAKRKDLIKIMIMDLGFDIDSIRKYTSPKVANNFESVLSQINNEDMVRYLVVEMKAKVNTNKCSYVCPSPLMYAVSYSSFQIVKLLVEELGADVNFEVSHNEDGSRPFLALHWAIYTAI
jgi:hypothetical protein